MDVSTRGHKSCTTHTRAPCHVHLARDMQSYTSSVWGIKTFSRFSPRAWPWPYLHWSHARTISLSPDPTLQRPHSPRALLSALRARDVLGVQYAIAVGASGLLRLKSRSVTKSCEDYGYRYLLLSTYFHKWGSMGASRPPLFIADIPRGGPVQSTSASALAFWRRGWGFNNLTQTPQWARVVSRTPTPALGLPSS